MAWQLIPKKINMKNNIENTARSYQDLIDEVEKEQAKMLKELKYVLTGVVGGRELSEQEFQCFYERAVNKYPFADIAFNLRISESACKTYYNRALKKLSKQATLITHLLRRK
jgi:DNA-directed RNA polymerase specialized sigma24 family protein